MCGIVAYVGNKRVAPLLVEGLKRLEYRGYDSAGVAVVRPEGVKVAHIGDYYAKSSTDANAWIVANLKIPANQVGTHAGIIDTSQLMWVNPAMIRFDKLEAGSATNGIAGDPRAATPAIGQALLQIKIDNALAQIRQLTGLQVAHPAEAKAIYNDTFVPVKF